MRRLRVARGRTVGRGYLWCMVTRCLCRSMVFVVFVVCTDVVGVVFTMNMDLQTGAAAGRYLRGKYGSTKCESTAAALFPFSKYVEKG